MGSGQSEFSFLKKKMLAMEEVEVSYMIATYMLMENIDYNNSRLFLEKLSRKRGIDLRIRAEI